MSDFKQKLLDKIVFLFCLSRWQRDESQRWRFFDIVEGLRMEWTGKIFQGERKEETTEISMASQVTSSRVLPWEWERHYEAVINKMLVVIGCRQ